MVDGIRTVVVGADQLAASLGAASLEVAAFTLATTRTYGQLLQTAVRGKASGRPGPRSQTGDYRRSITLQMVNARGSVSAMVGTNSPQGRRLEFGFAPGIPPQGGVDILGRAFHQQPLPHFGPALDEVGGAYRTAMSTGIAAIVARRAV